MDFIASPPKNPEFHCAHGKPPLGGLQLALCYLTEDLNGSDHNFWLHNEQYFL